MREPEWVYRQRRQRAAVALVMAIAGIAWLFAVGPAFIGGFDLDGRSHVALDKPNVDEILARERRQIEAEKKRKAERRENRAERRDRPRKPRKKKRSGGEQSPPARSGAGTTPAPASTPPPAPQPAPQPDPATAEAPELPQQSAPQQPSEGPVDPRFY